jgi:ribosome maturation factor RimP
MERRAVVAQVEEMLAPIVRRYALTVADVELMGQGTRTVLRVVVEGPGEDAPGVTVEELARVSEALSRQLDLRDLIPHAYTLEVSSPGLDRPLKKEQDFVRFAGREVEVWTFAPIEHQRHFRGRLLGLEGGAVRLAVGPRLVVLPRDQVTRARLVIDEESLKKDLAGGAR